MATHKHWRTRNLIAFLDRPTTLTARKGLSLSPAVESGHYGYLNLRIGHTLLSVTKRTAR